MLSARASPKRYVLHSLSLQAPRGRGWLTNPKKAATSGRTATSHSAFATCSNGSGKARSEMGMGGYGPKWSASPGRPGKMMLEEMLVDARSNAADIPAARGQHWGEHGPAGAPGEFTVPACRKRGKGRLARHFPMACWGIVGDSLSPHQKRTREASPKSLIFFMG